MNEPTQHTAAARIDRIRLAAASAGNLFGRVLSWVVAPSLAAASLSGCANFNMIPVEQDPVLGAQAYPELLANDRLIESGADFQMVVTMTDRLVRAAKGEDPDIANLFEWEVVLVDKPELVNAWCLPGGKMAVYTGILPVADDGSGDKETGLAVVMGHEIAHATLRHGTKAMSRSNLSNLALQVVSAVAGNGQGAQLAMLGAQLATNLGSLTYGRSAELDADRRGLTYMARAGYDPRAAVGFWQRMKAASGGQAPPEWLSTHPSNENRIKQIESLLPEVIPIYEASRNPSSDQSGSSKGPKSFR